MRPFLACASLALYTVTAQAQPQTFSSGSTGADGPLTYAANLGLVYFPPSALAMRPSNVYNFTTITIGAGTTVRLSGWVFNGPVYWLAQGDVAINGLLDLSGQPGHPANSPSLRAPSEPGAGGYSGGVAALGAGQNATGGNGPGGGPAPGYNSSTPFVGGPGTFSGSNYLQPLIGGSGGAGGGNPSTSGGGGGGAGGGAILIASSTRISANINAQGGVGGGNYSGGGSGGAVRLVSNQITSVSISVAGNGGGSGGTTGGGGLVRLEAYTLSDNGESGGTLITSIPYNLSLPVGGLSTVSVTSVNGVAINANPFNFPDAAIATAVAVPVVISGVNVPPGTMGDLYVFSETAADQVFPFTLAGTIASTTATVNVPYPAGGSRGFAKATW